MTGRPSFDPISPEVVTAADMTLISSSSLQRFDSLADLNAAIDKPELGEMAMVLDQDPPWLSYRGETDGWVPVRAAAVTINTRAPAQTGPVAVGTRAPAAVSTPWRGYVEPEYGDLPDVYFSEPGGIGGAGRRTEITAGAAAYGTDTRPYAGTILPGAGAASDGQRIMLIADDGAVAGFYPPHAGVLEDLSHPPGSSIAFSNISAIAWNFEDSKLYAMGRFGAQDLLYEVPTSGNGAWALLGPITGMGNPPASACWHRGTLYVAEHRTFTGGISQPSNLYALDVATRTATSLGTVPWPNPEPGNPGQSDVTHIGDPEGIASHRGRLYAVIPESFGASEPLRIHRPLFRLQPREGRAWDPEVAAETIVAHPVAGIVSCRTAVEDNGLRLWYCSVIGGNRVRHVPYFYDVPLAPWD